MHILSGHDVSIMAFLNAFGLSLQRPVPGFAAAILVELLDDAVQSNLPNVPAGLGNDDVLVGNEGRGAGAREQVGLALRHANGVVRGGRVTRLDRRQAANRPQRLFLGRVGG